MRLENDAPGGDGEATSVFELPKDALNDAVDPIREAARLLASARKPKQQAAPAAPDEGSQYEPAQESEAKAEDASPEEAPGEAEEADPAEQLPPVEPPRSWTKEDKELFNSLPRETQERLSDRERSRERDFLQRQNEAAEKIKGLSVKEQALEQQRSQYEAALPVLLQNLQSGMAAEFADIRTMSDVTQMANEDWPRYVRWDAAQKQAAAVQNELTATEQRRQAERSQKWNEYVSREDQLFNEKVPEMADAKKAAQLRDSAIKTLEDIGFTQNELSKMWHENDVFRDHRMQMLILDAVKYRDGQAKAKTITAKPLPKVQAPGTARGKGDSEMGRLQNLTQQLENASGMNALRIATEIRRMQQSGR
jgi:hypothetical protein